MKAALRKSTMNSDTQEKNRSKNSVTAKPSPFLLSLFLTSSHLPSPPLKAICEKIFRPWFSPTLLGAKAGLPLQVPLSAL